MAQTNDVLLTLLLYDCATEIASDTILFHDALTTHLDIPEVTFRPVTEADKERIFEHKAEPVGDWLIERDGVIVATGGITTHYNPPYGDLYMEVDERFRRRGYGSYLIQELKRASYETGLVPAAALQRREHGVAGDASEGGALAVRPSPERGSCVRLNDLRRK